MTTTEQTRFDDLYHQHLTALKLQGKAARTIDGYSRALRRVAEFVGRCPDNLTADELKAHFAALVDSHSWSTVKVDRSGIQFFYRYVLQRPWDWIEIVQPPKTRRLPDILTPTEIARLITVTRYLRYRCFWLTTYGLGLRLSETLNLQVSDIDADRCQVHVRHGKGAKDRFVVLPTLVLLALRAWWRAHRHPRLLFPGRRGGDGTPASGVMDFGSTQKAFALVVRAAGIKKRATIHTLRHSYATHLVEAGLNLRNVQLLLGHNNPNTTVRYTHMTERSLSNSQEQVNGLMQALSLDAAVLGLPTGRRRES